MEAAPVIIICIVVFSVICLLYGLVSSLRNANSVEEASQSNVVYNEESTRSVDSDTEEFLSHLSRSEATAITRMISRPPPSSSSAATITSPSPVPRPSTELIINEFILRPMPMARARAPVNDLPPAYDEAVEIEEYQKPSYETELPYLVNPPEYSVFVISNENLPPVPPPVYNVGIR